MAKVSLCSVVGLTGPRTMKLGGEVNGQHVVVMIDPGASHNFISTTALHRLRLQVSGNYSFGVSLGDRSSVHGKGVC